MIRIRAFDSNDVYKINVQPAQKDEVGLLDPTTNPEAYTVYDDTNNFVICIIVFTPINNERCSVGALLSADSGKYFVSLRRIVFKFLDLYNFPRLECLVKADFKAGHRLVKLLGFMYEGTLHRLSKGQDYCIYARLN